MLFLCANLQQSNPLDLCQNMDFAQYLENEWTALNQICIHITIDKVYAGFVKHFLNANLQQSSPIDWCRNLVFAPYFENE